MRIFSFHPNRWGGRRTRRCPNSRVFANAGGLAGLLRRWLPVIGLLFLGGLPARGVTAQWPGEISGQIVDERTGLGVPGVRITVEGSALSALTEGDGGFLLRPVEAGDARLRIQRYGYAPADVVVSVRPGITTRVTVRIGPAAFELDRVEVSAERHAPGTTVLDREWILRSGAATLGGVLDGVAGLSVVRRGAGGEETVTIRGAPASHTLILVDGVPLNDPVTGVADLSSLAARSIERIEVLPGARGARYGPGAMGGVVLISTHVRGPSLTASTALGSLGERRAGVDGRRRMMGVEFRAGGWASTLGGGFAFERDPQVGGGRADRENADSREVGFRFGLGTTRDLSGSLWEVGVRGSRLERGVPGKSYAPSREARQELEQGAVRFRLERPVQIDGNDVELRVRSGVDHRELRFVDPDPPLGPPFDDRSRGLTFDLGLELDGLATVGDRITVGGGLEGRALSLDADVLSTSDDALRQVDVGAFVHVETVPLELPLAPVLHGALRVDRGRKGPVASHELSIRFDFGGTGNLHVAHRSAFAPPSAGDQFFREGVGIAPNPDLRAERIPGELEIGGALPVGVGSADGRLTLLHFRGDVRDHIVWTPDFRFVWSPRNVDVRRRGWTIQSELRHPSGVSVSAHATRAEVRYLRRDGTRSSQLAYRPRLTAGLTTRWSGDRWRVSTGTRYVGPRFPVPAPVNELPSFWSTDLSLSRLTHVASWEVRSTLRVERLFDEKAPFIFSIPEPGRTFRLELEVRRLP